MRVAFASTRGTTVDEHFGRAATFAIHEVGAEGHTLVEFRAVADGPFDLAVIETRGSGAAHDDAIERKIDKLGDCRMVYFTEIGGPSAAKLVQRGIMPLKTEQGSSVTHIADSLVARIKDNPPPWMRKALSADGE